MTHERSRFEGSRILTCLDGSNPLAFLAALGTLRLLSSVWANATVKLGWVNVGGTWRAVLVSPDLRTEDDILACLDGTLSTSKRCHKSLGGLGDDLSVHPDRFRAIAVAAKPATASDRSVADFLAAFGCDATPNHKGDTIQDTAFRTMAGAGHQHFLGFMRNIADATTADHLQKALFAEWEYDDPVEKLTMRWDPNDDTRYALQWRNPSGDPQRKTGGSVLGANRLAIEALPLFPTAPVGSRLVTTGFRGRRSRDTYWTWPIWNQPASVDVARSILAMQELQQSEFDNNLRRRLTARGVCEVYQVQRLTIGKVRNFSPSQSL